MRGWRGLWRRGPKHGPARGVVVFGAPGFADDAPGLTHLLGRHEELAAWVRAGGGELQVSTAGLHAVDILIDTWRDVPELDAKLANRVGLFVGTVLVQEVTGARWFIWPNGHPVIRLVTGKDLDVTALTETRVRTGHPPLTTIIDQVG